MRIPFSRPESCRTVLFSLLSVTTLLQVPNAVSAQRGTTKTISGQMLPLQPLPTAMQPGVTAHMNRLRRAVCNPAQPSGGPGPTAFHDAMAPWPYIYWEVVPGAVAYQVERAVDGTNNWVLAGSTCNSPDALREDASSGRSYITFQDIAGGLRMAETYVYKVSAIGATGEVGWNSFRWSASIGVQPLLQSVVAGSTVTLTVSLLTSSSLGPCVGSWPLEITITATYGLSRIVPLGSGCSPLQSVVVYGVPMGTHTFTASAHWIQSMDPAMPRVMLTTSRDTVITIKP